MRIGQVLLIAVLVGGLQSAALAQRSISNRPPKRTRPPVITGVFSVKSYNALRESLAYLANVSGQPHAPKMLDGIITALTGGNGLLGIAKNKPFGVALLTYGGQEAWPLVFIPIRSQDKALQLLHAVGPIIMRKFGPMPYKLTDDSFLMGPALSHIPENHVPSPSRLINASAAKFDVAFTANVQEIPMLTVENTFKRLDDLVDHPSFPNNLSFRQGRRFGAMMMRSVGQLVVSGARQVTLGVDIAPKRKRVAFELTLETKHGTELHRLIESLTLNPSHLAGLVDPAGLASCMLNIPLSSRAKNQLLAMMPTVREIPAFLNRRSGGTVTSEQQLLSLFRKTVEAGRLEVAFSLRGNPPGPLTLVGSAVVVNAKAIEKLMIRQIEVDHNRNRLKFAREVTRFRTVPIHALRVPGLKMFKKYFGNDPVVHFAATSDMLHIAFGGLSLDSVRWAIDRTSGTRRFSNRFSPLVLQGRLLPWLSLVSDPKIAALRKKISPSERISLVVTPASRSLNARFEIQEGLLRLIGTQASGGSTGIQFGR